MSGRETGRKLSGYTGCGCRDCFDIAISSDVTKPALCLACESAGCEAGTETECSRDDAYGCDEDSEAAQ